MNKSFNRKMYSVEIHEFKRPKTINWRLILYSICPRAGLLHSLYTHFKISRLNHVISYSNSDRTNNFYTHCHDGENNNVSVHTKKLQCIKIVMKMKIT